MAEFVSDTFTGADGTALAAHSPEVGGAWIDDRAGLVLSGGAVSVAPSGFLNSSHNAAVPPSSDYSVAADIRSPASGGGAAIGVTGRHVAGGGDEGYYASYYPGAGIWRLYAMSGGFSMIGDYEGPIAPGGTKRVTLRMAGENITVLVDDVVRIAAVNSALPDAGFAGLWCENGTVGDLVADNFLAFSGSPDGVHEDISGRGFFDLLGREWLQTSIAGRPAYLTHGQAEPPNWYHVGMLSWGTVNGVMQAYPVTRDADLVRIPSGMTRLYYEFAGGVVATIVELVAP